MSLVLNEERTGKKSVTAEIVLDAYKDYLKDIMDDDLNQVFMQDNAKVHTAKIVLERLDEQDYSIMSWPPYSPDLNPIRMIWYCIKTYIYKHHPELRRMTAGEEKTMEAIVNAVIEAWEALDEDFLWSLVQSMPRRVEAVIKAYGGYTQY